MLYDSSLLLPALVLGWREIHPEGLPAIDHISPGNGRECLWRVPICGDAQIAGAAADARRARCEWAETSRRERRERLLALAALVEAAAEPLALQIAAEVGKPLRDARQEAAFAVELLRSAARTAAESGGCPEGRGWYARRCPLGVIGVITPWNNPLAIALGKIGPALVYGNTVVWKPAPAGAALALAVLRLFREAGLPPGTVNLVQGDGTTAERLVSDLQIDAVTLTGSLTAGAAAEAICAGRRIAFQGELGGNNAAVIWSDADLSLAAQQVALGGFGSAGQRCTANRRVIVDHHCYADFFGALQKAVAELTWGDPLNDTTQVGPVISAAALARIARAIARARDSGAAIVTPHAKPFPQGVVPTGFYYPPTVVACDDRLTEIVADETFGPVLVVQQASTWDHAMRLLNGVPQGLVAALFSRSPDLQRRFLAEARTGLVKINSSTAGAAAEAPFGGWKASGVGPPEHGPADVEFFTRWQTVYDAGHRPAPADVQT